MDEETHNENKTKQMSKTEQEMLSSRAAVPVEEWESAASDTESLVQERDYQQQLQKNLSHHKQNKHTLAQRNNVYCSMSSDDEGTTDNNTEYFQVYDSLEEEDHLHTKKSLTPPQSAHNEKREGRGQHLSVDAYSDLRYDPNWRSNLKAAVHFKEGTVPSDTEYNEVQRNRCSQPCANGQEVVLKGGYSYIVDTHPGGVAVTSPLAPMQSDQPYHLHPPDCQPGSGISPSDNQNSSQEVHFASLSCPSPKYEEDKRALHIQQLKNYNQEGQGGADRRANESRQTMAHTIPKVTSRKKLEGAMTDIVKRNKVTLGRGNPERSSYMMVHALKKTPYTTTKVTQISREKKEKSTSPQQCLPALEVRTEQGDGLKSPLAIQTSFSPPKHLEMPHTINLNINLNTLSHLLQSQQRGQAEVINPASLQGCPHWISTSELQVTLSPPYLQKNPPEFSLMSQKGVALQLRNKNLEMSPETQLRAAAWKQLLSYEKEKSPNEVYCQESPKQLLGTPGSGPHTVLPPIGEPLRGGGVEMIPGQNVDPAEPLHRSSSDGYLAQMERQKQKGRGTHKALDFTDKQLKSKKYLQGLGPNYTVMEEAKLKRRRLYSNVIQEQNKKIHRIPFLLTKDPQSNNKTDPRMKALEYAKTIAKRPVQAQPKQRQEHKSKSVPEHVSCLEGLDVFQPAALDVFRRRHEEEKQLVALTRKFGRLDM